MSTDETQERLNTLRTTRDWLRYATSAFTRANLAFGHGTSTALDEAAFLILASLDLPIDEISSWLDAKLLPAERARIDSLIRARIETRQPAAYLLNRAYIQGRAFYVDERVIVPRSFIGELLLDRTISGLLPDGQDVNRVLDLCTGSGCLAILAAEVFPSASIVASDVSGDALEVSERNIADYGLKDRIALAKSDLFGSLGEDRFDIIISNPPYVTAASVNAFPPEYRAEPELAHLGGADGLDLVHRILDTAAEHLTPSGVLIVEIGDGRARLEEARPNLPFIWLDTDASQGEVFALWASDLA